MTKKISEYEYERADVAGALAYLDDAIQKAENAKSAEELAALRERVNKYFNDFGSTVGLAMIRHTLDVRDKFYAAEQDYYDGSLPPLWAKRTDFDRALISNPYSERLGELINPLIVRKLKAGLRVMDSSIVDDCVEENKLVTEYDTLLASLKFPWNGKTVTLSEMHGFCKDKDRAVRKKAFAVLGETLASAGDKLDGIFDGLVKVRTRMAQKLGFENFVEMGDLRVGHIGYGRKEIAVFRKSVLENAVPALAALKKRLCPILGIDSVHIYDNDNYVAGGNIDPVGDAEQLFAAAQAIYDDMDGRLGGFFRSMCEAEAFDYKAREGKISGGYADMLFKYDQPFIFANFNGTMDDVGVLTHEFGHAYAFKRSVENGVDTELFVGGMETAETHSMSMEALCNNYNDRFYGNRAREATYQQIFDAFDFLPYGVIVDYFQELVYTRPEMTPAERRALWLELEREYRPYVDMSDTPYINIGGRWQYQKHIYESPFYYIDYCLSTCLALQFGEIARTDFKDALSRYLALVDKGGSKDIDALAHEAGLNSPFDEGALRELCAAVVEHIKELM